MGEKHHSVARFFHAKVRHKMTSLYTDSTSLRLQSQGDRIANSVRHTAPRPKRSSTPEFEPN